MCLSEQYSAIIELGEEHQTKGYVQKSTMFSDNYFSKFQVKNEYSSKIIKKIHNVCHKIQ